MLYAEQQPTAAALFGDRTTASAWHTSPSFYAVSKDDQTIAPDLERFLCQAHERQDHRTERGPSLPGLSLLRRSPT